jgi:hypothetical protein
VLDRYMRIVGWVDFAGIVFQQSKGERSSMRAKLTPARGVSCAIRSRSSGYLPAGYIFSRSADWHECGFTHHMGLTAAIRFVGGFTEMPSG